MNLLKKIFKTSRRCALAALAITLTTSSQAILDTNVNGLSDIWEKHYNTALFTPTNPAHAPTADPDQDGWTNAQEAIAGTNPFDGTLPIGKTTLQISSGALPGTYLLSWPAIQGKKYRVQASTNLRFWVNVGPLILNNDYEPREQLGLQASDPDDPNAAVPVRLFWRVKVDDFDDDGDGLSTAEEHFLGTYTWSEDSDGDSLSDLQELLLGTNPKNADSDGDGADDGKETEDETDPKSNADFVKWTVLNRSLEYDFDIHPPPASSTGLIGWVCSWDFSQNRQEQLTERIPFPDLHERLEEIAFPSSPPTTLVTGVIGATTSEARVAPNPPCHHAVMSHLGVWLQRSTGAGRPELKQKLIVLTTRHLNDAEPTLTVETEEVVVPAESTLSQLVELKGEFQHDQNGNVEHRETFTIKPIYADLDFIQPGTEGDPRPKPLADDKEDDEGEVVCVNWDDDDNSEGGGAHGKLAFDNDHANPPETQNENDLIKLRISKVAHAGAITRLKYNNDKIRIWKNSNRTEEVVSQQTTFETQENAYVYLEGKKITAAATPEVVTLELKIPEKPEYIEADTVDVHVATPVITFFGTSGAYDGVATLNLVEQLRNKKYLGKNRRDDRNNTVILKGKNQQGATIWYSVDMIDVKQRKEGVGSQTRPKINIRKPSLDKEMKMALSLEGAHVYYSGHSNFGLGPNFKPEGTTTVDDYMNLSGQGKTAIIVKSDHAEEPNPMLTPGHGGPNFALRPADIVDQVTNYMVPWAGELKYDGPAVGATLTKKTHADGTPYHYERMDKHKNWITIVHSTGDVPTLRSASCFMASCNSGRHFAESLNHGTLIFSTDLTYGGIGGKLARLKGDHYTEKYSWGITHYVKLLTEGKSWAEIVTFLNQNQYFKADLQAPNNMNNYKHKTFAAP